MKRDTELPDIYSWVVCDVCGEWCHPTEVSYRYDDDCEEVICDECRPTLRAVDVCPSCAGKGTYQIGVYSETCSACHGTGTRQ